MCNLCRCVCVCACVCVSAWMCVAVPAVGNLQAVLPPADSCLTAVAEGLGEAVKSQLNKPCVSSSNSKPDITPPHRRSAVGLTVCVEGNVCHLNKCLQLRHQICQCVTVSIIYNTHQRVKNFRSCV